MMMLMIMVVVVVVVVMMVVMVVVGRLQKFFFQFIGFCFFCAVGRMQRLGDDFSASPGSLNTVRTRSRPAPGGVRPPDLP